MKGRKKVDDCLSPLKAICTDSADMESITAFQNKWKSIKQPTAIWNQTLSAQKFMYVITNQPKPFFFLFQNIIIPINLISRQTETGNRVLTIIFQMQFIKGRFVSKTICIVTNVKEDIFYYILNQILILLKFEGCTFARKQYI